MIWVHKSSHAPTDPFSVGVRRWPPEQQSVIRRRRMLCSSTSRQLPSLHLHRMPLRSSTSSAARRSRSPFSGTRTGPRIWMTPTSISQHAALLSRCDARGGRRRVDDRRHDRGLPTHRRSSRLKLTDKSTRSSSTSERWLSPDAARSVSQAQFQSTSPGTIDASATRSIPPSGPERSAPMQFNHTNDAYPVRDLNPCYHLERVAS